MAIKISETSHPNGVTIKTIEKENRTFYRFRIQMTTGNMLEAIDMVKLADQFIATMSTFGTITFDNSHYDPGIILADESYWISADVIENCIRLSTSRTTYQDRFDMMKTVCEALAPIVNPN